MALFLRNYLHAQAKTSAYLQKHLAHATHRSCTFEVSQCAVVCSRKKLGGGR